MGERAQDFHTGEYKNADGSLHTPKYFKQLGVWLLIVTCMKASMVGLMFAANEPLQQTAHLVLTPVMNNNHVKLLVVMILTPFCMNTLQFWITDNFIRKAEVGEALNVRNKEDYTPVDG